MKKHNCLNCGGRITYQFAICSECEEVQGRSALEWTPWLRWLWNDTQRERRREVKLQAHEVTFSDIRPHPPALSYTKTAKRRIEDMGWVGKNYTLPDCSMPSDDGSLLESMDIGSLLRKQCTQTRKVLQRKAEGYTQENIADEIGKSRTLVGTILTTVRGSLEQEGLF